ncbi:MAG: hypothetical protein M1142_05260 [Patescibacteria group bacterium]|nr:hypothetical protein [Patescibacteria group bacterium]
MKNGDPVIENYLRAIEKLIERGGEKKFWPFAPGQVDSYFIDVFSVNLFEKFKRNREKFKDAFATLNTTVIRWFGLPYVILGLKLANNYEGYCASQEEMTDYIRAVDEVLSKKVYSDPFCLDGQNKTMLDQEAKDKFEKIHRFDARDKKAINIFSSILQSYLWSIEFDAFTYGASWHGPYTVDSKKMICKTYSDLNAQIWKIQNLPDRVDIFYLFEGDIDWRVGLMELAVFQPDLWDRLDSIGILVDNKTVDNLDNVQKLSEQFSQVRDQQVSLIDGLPPEEIIKKGIEIYYFMFRNFFEFYQESSKPPEVCYQRIKDDGLKYWNAFKQESVKELMPGKDFFKRLYDPSNNFTG